MGLDSVTGHEIDDRGLLISTPNTDSRPSWQPPDLPVNIPCPALLTHANELRPNMVICLNFYCENRNISGDGGRPCCLLGWQGCNFTWRLSSIYRNLSQYQVKHTIKEVLVCHSITPINGILFFMFIWSREFRSIVNGRGRGCKIIPFNLTANETPWGINL